MITNEMYERVAKNVGCSVASLVERHTACKDLNAVALAKSGVASDQIETKTLRMVAAEIRAESARLKRSGCKMVEGMFLSFPRFKDWGKVFYTKYSKMLSELGEEARQNLVAQGLVNLYLHDDENGGYRVLQNASLASKVSFEEGFTESHTDVLPKQAMALNDGTGYFACIENKTTPTYPSGGVNYAYGKLRANEDLERTVLFMGREVGTEEIKILPMKFKGKMAKQVMPTFMPLRIPVVVGKNGLYAKANVSVPTLDASVANVFPAPPLASDGTGLLADMQNIPLLNGLDSIEGHVNGLNDAEKWDALASVVLEVAHIDPRENGGYILTCADMDLTSMSAPLDLYVSSQEERKVDFGVGSVVVVVGQPYISRDGDARLAITGWHCVESMGVHAAEEDAIEEEHRQKTLQEDW
jgi:hypothetical protein